MIVTEPWNIKYMHYSCNIEIIPGLAMLADPRIENIASQLHCNASLLLLLTRRNTCHFKTNIAAFL